jgi:hypothetical protein
MVQTIEDDFVILEKQDAIEAVAYYIASFVQQSPEAQALGPKELQQALQVTFKVGAPCASGPPGTCFNVHPQWCHRACRR